MPAGYSAMDVWVLEGWNEGLLIHHMNETMTLSTERRCARIRSDLMAVMLIWRSVESPLMQRPGQSHHPSLKRLLMICVCFFEVNFFRFDLINHRFQLIIYITSIVAVSSASMSTHGLPPYLPPSPSIEPLSEPSIQVPLTFEEALLISVYLATAIYGINIVLSLACLRSGVFSTAAPSSRIKALMFNGYIFIMVCLASEATIEDALSSAANFKDRTSFTGNLCTPYALPLSILGADGFMVRIDNEASAFYGIDWFINKIWRCYILYGALTGKMKYLFTTMLAILGCSSLGVLGISESSPWVTPTYYYIRVSSVVLGWGLCRERRFSGANRTGTRLFLLILAQHLCPVCGDGRGQYFGLGSHCRTPTLWASSSSDIST